MKSDDTGKQTMEVRKRLSSVIRRARQFYSTAYLVSNRFGKNIVHQAIEVFRLRYGGVKLSGREYYAYSLYDDIIFSSTAKREFISKRKAKRLYKHLNEPGWRDVATDKVLFYSLLKGLGFPFPSLYAVYHHAHRYCGPVPFIRQPEALTLFLRRDIPFPFFSKPVRGSHGIGAVAVSHIDCKSDQLIFANGDRIGVETFVHTLLSAKGGQLFQEYLPSQPRVVEVCGDFLSSIRMLVLLSADGPKLIRAVWKIPQGRNMTDNFNHGMSGNLLGQIDVVTGRVERVIAGIGPEQVEANLHPDTREPIKGLFLPDWRNAVDLCMSAASALPGLRFQHWDIALSLNGPVILEVNANGDLDLAQLAYRSGLYDAEFRAYFDHTASLQ